MLGVRSAQDPALYRRRLRRRLRQERERAGLAQRDVAAAMDWSLSKLVRIETGAVSITTNDLKAVLAHYRVRNELVDSLLELARSARRRSAWSAYKDIISPEFMSYLAYEASASVLRTFEPLLVPGLLQTEEYARTVLGEIRGPNPRTVARLTELRMRRQRIVERDISSSFHFFLDEAVIHRIVGGREIMRRQLQRIIEIGRLPNVTVHVVPFAAGIYPRVRVSYVLLDLPEPDNERVLFIENPDGDLITETDTEAPDAGRPASYLATFRALEKIVSSETSASLLDAATARLMSSSGIDMPKGRA